MFGILFDQQYWLSKFMLFLYPMYNRLSELLLIDVMISVVESRVRQDIVYLNQYSSDIVNWHW